jgi:hypothetical protein
VIEFCEQPMELTADQIEAALANRFTDDGFSNCEGFLVTG